MFTEKTTTKMADLQYKKVTIKEVIYILMAGSSFLAQYYSLRQDNRDTVATFNSEKRVVDLRLAALEKQDDYHDLTLRTMATSIGEMIEASSPRLQTQTRKRQ